MVEASILTFMICARRFGEIPVMDNADPKWDLAILVGWNFLKITMRVQPA